MSVYSAGLTALNAAKLGIATTGHNIANVNTTGFRRQEIIQTTSSPVNSGAGFIGQGTNVDTIRRVYDDFMERQVAQNESQAAYDSQYLQGAQQLDNVMGDRRAGLSTSLQQFFQSWNDLSSSPTSTAARQSVLGASQTVANNINTMGGYIQTLQESADTQIQGMVSQINGYARSIASMNERISSINAGQPVNDLMDQRDQMVSELSQLTKVTVLKEASTGNYNVFMGTSYQLVAGVNANSITAGPSVYDSSRIEVFDAGGSNQLSANALSSGKLGAVLDYRSNVLDMAQNSLGRIAMALTASVNDQHQLGQDMNGAAGGLFFNSTASLPQAFSSSNNASAAGVTAAVTDASQLTNSDYSLSFNAGVYTLSRLSDGASWNNANIATLATNAAQGFSLSISAVPTAGDSFLIRPTSAAATNLGVAISDPLSIAAASPISAGTAAANTGSALITQPTVNASNQPPLNANLTSAVTFTFTSSSAFDVSGSGTGNPAGVAYTSGGSITYNGWTLQISGTPAAGDVFTIGPNTGGTFDNRNALSISAFQSDNTLVGGSSTIEGGYALLVGDIGNITAEAKVNSLAQSSLLQQAKNAQQSASGVNLDEEAANLIRYQQAYQAAAQIIKTASTMFDTLLSIGG